MQLRLLGTLLVPSLLAALPACDHATTLRVQLDAAPGTSIAQLFVTATLSSPNRSERRRVPDDGGTPSLPGALLVFLPDVASDLTVEVEGLDTAGSSFREQRSTRSVPHDQVELAFLLAGKTAPSLVSPLVFQEVGQPTPSGWTCVSCSNVDPYYQRFPVGAAEAGGSGGAETHAHQGSATVATTTSLVGTGNAESLVDAASAMHVHLASVMVGPASNLPAYRDLKILRADQPVAGLFAGAIVVFDGGLGGVVPAGWQRLAAQDGQFVRGEGVQSTDKPTNRVSSHGITVTIQEPVENIMIKSCSAGSGPCEQPLAPSKHAHTVSPTTSDAFAPEPRHALVTFAVALPSAQAVPIPLGAILPFEAPPPATWTVLSAPGGPLAGAFLRGGSAAQLATVGADTHAHMSIAATTLSNMLPGVDPLARGDKNVTVSPIGLPMAQHEHAITISLEPADHRPPYREVILARRAQ
jgi:hypothetical protein